MFKLWEDFKAKRRGEVRVAPGLRGRIYAKKEEIAEAGDHSAKTKGKAFLHMKITRADGSIEELTVPATVEVKPNG